MFTKDLLFGMNMVTLAGFALMGIGLTFNRQGKIRFSMAVALLGAGTALIFLGLYLPAPPSP